DRVPTDHPARKPIIPKDLLVGRHAGEGARISECTKAQYGVFRRNGDAGSCINAAPATETAHYPNVKQARQSFRPHGGFWAMEPPAKATRFFGSFNFLTQRKLAIPYARP